MPEVALNLIQKMDDLWNPVYHYLAIQIQELYDRNYGAVLEMGPFCGVIFTLQEMKIGSSFSIATFPPEMGEFFKRKTGDLKLEKKIKVMETDPSLSGIGADQMDLVVFRGGLFFPSLFQVDYFGIHRVLRPNGLALIGGGFGKYTPDSLVRKIREKSRDLNRQIGMVEVDRDQLKQEIQRSNLPGEIKILSEGGLWVLLKK